MARGWESKSVEEQIEAFRSERVIPVGEGPSPAEIELLRKRGNLELSRTRVLRELASSQNPRYQEILQKALSDLEARISSCTA